MKCLKIGGRRNLIYSNLIFIKVKDQHKEDKVQEIKRHKIPQNKIRYKKLKSIKTKNKKDWPAIKTMLKGGRKILDILIKKLHKEHLPGRISYTQRLPFVLPRILPLLVDWGRWKFLILWALLHISQVFIITKAIVFSPEGYIHQTLTFPQNLFPSRRNMSVTWCPSGVRKIHQVEEQSHWHLCISGSIINLRKKTKRHALTYSSASRIPKVNSPQQQMEWRIVGKIKKVLSYAANHRPKWPHYPFF